MTKSSAHLRKKKSAGRVRPMTRADAAGIDLGATIHYVAVPPERDPQPVRSFGAYTEDLHALADWLVACKITAVAMEATGVYWIPLFQILEKRKIDVRLVNAHHVKNVRGRKTDVVDCQWIQRLFTLRHSLKPTGGTRS